MKYGYARVSTDLQTTDGQIDALHAAGCERVFEESMSGTRADRPQLAAALAFAREGDVLVVARLDRLAGIAVKHRARRRAVDELRAPAQRRARIGRAGADRFAAARLDRRRARRSACGDD